MKHVVTGLVLALSLVLAPHAWADEGEKTEGKEKPPASPWEAMTRHYDLDKDGKITWEEYRKVQSGFTTLDADGDGTISKEDFEKRARSPVVTWFGARGHGDGDGDGDGDGNTEQLEKLLRLFGAAHGRGHGIGLFGVPRMVHPHGSMTILGGPMGWSTWGGHPGFGRGMPFGMHGMGGMPFGHFRRGHGGMGLWHLLRHLHGARMHHGGFGMGMPGMHHGFGWGGHHGMGHRMGPWGMSHGGMRSPVPHGFPHGMPFGHAAPFGHRLPFGGAQGPQGWFGALHEAHEKEKGEHGAPKARKPHGDKSHGMPPGMPPMMGGGPFTFGGEHGGPGAFMLIGRTADKNHDMRVTKEEWRAFLDGLEAGEDGVISKEKLEALMPFPMPGGAQGFLNQMLDADKDGKVEVEDLEAAFTKHDKNKDGVVEMKEVMPFVSAFGEMPEGK